MIPVNVKRAIPYCIPLEIHTAAGMTEGLFSNIRVSRKDTEGWHVYDLIERQISDDEYEFVALLNGVAVTDFGGAFITKADIGIPEGQALEFVQEPHGKKGIPLGMFDYSFS